MFSLVGMAIFIIICILYYCYLSQCSLNICLSWHHLRDFQRASCYAVATLDAIGMDEAFRVISALIRLQLHGTYCWTESALGGTLFANHDTAIVIRNSAAAGSRPWRQCSHRAERTPCARSVNKWKCHTHNGGNQYDCPEYTPHFIPVAPCTVHLYAEHGEDE